MFDNQKPSKRCEYKKRTQSIVYIGLAATHHHTRPCGMGIKSLEGQLFLKTKPVHGQVNLYCKFVKKYIDLKQLGLKNNNIEMNGCQ